ncbi:hypothetical protein GCK32_005428 [Trichostrongylus colubriformis]|uniref:Uncharacterized protein n=1 Tax=Trichostrongylus colubriformis TaxID=6319 RepID=A0AAN8G7K2_TRICO
MEGPRRFMLLKIARISAWLSKVEDSRTEGGYIGSEEGPSGEDKEYYLLCRRRVFPLPKRRRQTESSWDTAYEGEGSTVSCTAFVHVMERVDGSNLKRSSNSISDCGTEMTAEDNKITTPLTIIKDAEMICADVIEDNNNVNGKEKGESAAEVEFDTSTLNSQITQRLDTTTNRLKVITQVLADLAVDIHAFKDRQCAIVI